MKIFKSIILILIIFFKTGNVLSQNSLFNVNNIEIINKSSDNDEFLANEAIKKGFSQLIDRILLKNDVETLNKLNFKDIKQLVLYYQIFEDQNSKKKKFNIFFDKDKLHKLFYKEGISYSDILKNEIYLLPILKKDEKFYIYNKNYFYEKWNSIENSDLLEFILPIESIEIIQKINFYKNNLLEINLMEIFKEYDNKNLALILIEERGLKKEKIFLKTKINGKNINKNLIFIRSSLDQEEFYNKIISDIKKNLVDLVKSQNLIDIRTPSFLNVEFDLNKKNNLVELKNRMQKIDLIENIYIQEYNNNYVLVKIKYLGKIDKIIKELESQKIFLRLSNDKWRLKII